MERLCNPQSGFCDKIVQALVALCITVKVSGSIQESPVVVQTAHGPVEGEIIKNSDGFKVQAFRGIPFARAPTGDLRFRPPEPPIPWKEVLQTKAWPKACIQTHVFSSVKVNISEAAESEDCLFLNVFAPLEKSEGAYPVLVWIYGGGFYVGSTEHYGMVGINKRLVPKGVVMVTIQYRLGAFGFLSTGDSEVPGNIGLLDQTFALRWVRDNIRNFNGDPNRVTVFGESAGAGSSSLLTLSPRSRDLFNQAILMSGSAHAPWVLGTDEPVRATKRLASLLNCDSHLSKVLVQCLQQKQPQQIVDASLINKDDALERLGLEFSPIIDGQFLPKSIDKLLHEAPKKRIMTGLTSYEMNVFIAPILQNFTVKWASLIASHAFILANMTDALAELIPKNKFKSAELLQRIGLTYYVEAHGDRSNETFLLDQYIKLIGDATMYAPSYDNAISSAANGWTVFAYLFDYYSEDLLPKRYHFKGSGHAMELAYLFETPMWTVKPIIKFSQEEERIADLMATIWSNFAKFGDPKISDENQAHWTPIPSNIKEDGINYFRMGVNPTMETSGWLRRAAAFWSKLVPDIEASFAKVTGRSSTFSDRDEL